MPPPPPAAPLRGRWLETRLTSNQHVHLPPPHPHLSNVGPYWANVVLEEKRAGPALMPRIADCLSLFEQRLLHCYQQHCWLSRSQHFLSSRANHSSCHANWLSLLPSPTLMWPLLRPAFIHRPCIPCIQHHQHHILHVRVHLRRLHSPASNLLYNLQSGISKVAGGIVC